MTGNAPPPYPTFKSISTPFFLVLFISVVVITGVVFIGSRSVDKVSTNASIHLARSVLATVERRLEQLVKDTSYWDQAVDNLVAAPDPDWADSNVGMYLYEQHGTSSSYVFDADNRLVYGMKDGERWSDDPFSYFSNGLGILLDRTRAAPDTQVPRHSSGLLVAGNMVVLVSAGVLTTYDTEVDKPTQSVLMLARVLDTDLIAELAENFLLKGLRIQPPDTIPVAASIPLVAVDGTLIGYLAWQADTPGTSLLRWLLPLVAGVFIVLAGLVFVFVRQTSNVVTTLQTAKLATERLSHAVGAVPVGIALFDIDDKLVFFNTRYGELMEVIADILKPGVTFEEMTRTMVERQPVKDALAREEEYIQERIKHHRNPIGPFDLRRDNMWLLVHETRLADGGIFTIITDITERKQAEEELRKAQDDLVRQERLAVLGKLSATVSHELRNPLGTILTSITTITGITEGKELGIEGAIGRIERNIKRCDDIIVEMLDYTRDTAPNLEPTDVDDWLGGVLDEQDVPPGLSVERDLASGAEADIDRDRLRRAVVNVYDNACQAVEENGDGADNEVVVATKVNGERVEIVVTDNGPGIADDEVGKVFEPLYSTKSFGVGLGLPVVEKIVEEHGGGVHITSTIGRGTQATLWLPLAAPEQGGNEA